MNSNTAQGNTTKEVIQIGFKFDSTCCALVFLVFENSWFNRLVDFHLVLPVPVIQDIVPNDPVEHRDQ